MSIAIVVLATLTVGMMYASVFEWTLHKYVMHRPLGRFRYPFETHALTHHKLFGSDFSYHLQPSVKRQKIRMAFWNGPVLSIVGMVPFVAAAIIVDICAGRSEMYAVLAVGVVISIGYYLVYEYLHWCMHLPRDRRVERSRIFRMLNGHHVLHHRHKGTNFNVVFPFADAVLGTLLVRARKPFPQVRGKAVPDVQPSAA